MIEVWKRRIFQIALAVVCAFSGRPLLAQSPFNYGANDSIYFVSRAMREATGSDEIVNVYFYEDGQTGGMWENCDINISGFDEDGFYHNWLPVTVDSATAFYLDSIVAFGIPLNGLRVNFNGNKMTSYGGQGYGSFDWTDYHWTSDTLALTVTYCVGHCGDQQPSFKKVQYHADGRPKCTIFYNYHGEDYWLNDSTTVAQFDEEMGRYKEDSIISTVAHVVYDENGLLLSAAGEEYPEVFFNVTPDFGQFSEVRFGSVPLAEWATKNLHMKPKLLLFEIYQNAVFSYVLDESTQRYYQGRMVVLD